MAFRCRECGIGPTSKNPLKMEYGETPFDHTTICRQCDQDQIIKVRICFATYISNGSDNEMRDSKIYEMSKWTLFKFKNLLKEQGRRWDNDLNTVDWSDVMFSDDMQKIIEDIQDITEKSCNADYIEFYITKLIDLSEE